MRRGQEILPNHDNNVSESENKPEHLHIYVYT